MSQNDVNIWSLKALQAALETFNNVLPGQASGVGFLATSAKEDLFGIRWILMCREARAFYLGAENVFVARPIELL